MKVLYEKRGRVAYVTINNVEKANILDRETSHEIAEAWKEVWDDTDSTSHSRESGNLPAPGAAACPARLLVQDGHRR